jgi:hypothetical protein
MRTLLTVAGWAAALVLAWITASCLARQAVSRFWPGRSGIRLPLNAKILPGFAAGGCLAILAILGVRPLITGLTAAAAAGAATWPLLAGKNRVPAGSIPRVIASLPGTARLILADDLRQIAGRNPGTGRPAGQPVAGAPQWTAPARVRNVPHLLDDVNLGAHPGPEDVAMGLEHAAVPVPPHWERLAQVIADYEPEDDDDMTGHIAGEAAGVLTVSAAIENRTEHLALGRGLDPVLIEAHYDLADGFAELATRYALLVRRDHVLHGDVREWRDAGGVLPHDARGWFDAGSGDGGRAA